MLCSYSTRWIKSLNLLFALFRNKKRKKKDTSQENNRNRLFLDASMFIEKCLHTGLRKMHSWAKLSKVWQSWHVIKKDNKEAKLAKLVHIPIHSKIYYAKQSWQSWDINPLFKAKLAKLRYNFSNNGQSSNPRQS